MGGRPQFLLKRIQAGGAEEPGIFSVLFRPWEFQASRRRFLGLCLGLTGTFSAGRPSLLRGQTTSAATGTRVDPEVLSMAGIAASGKQDLDAGYHLRWFCAAPLPEQAFPAGPALGAYLSHADPGPLEFTGGEAGDSLAGSGINPKVPWAYFLYRRPHYEHFDRSLLLPAGTLTSSGPSTAVVSDVLCSLDQLAAQEALARSSRAARAALAGLTSLLVLRFAFQQSPGQGSGTRAVHYLRLTLKASGSAPRLVLRMYAREDDAPAREVVVTWRAEAGGWSASLKYTEGHYTSLELVGDRVPSVALDFSYMDEDLLGSGSKERPAWELIAKIPFITAFRTWEAARSRVFRNPLANRYIDLDGAGADWRSRLDFKYQPLFRKLQQAFLRLRQAELLGVTLLAEPSGNPVHVVESDPRFMFEFWSLDPNIAALFGQKFTNPVGVHDPFAATAGAKYDYMVSTAWGTKSQRLYYITQNVSLATTPPILPPTNLRTEQSEGRYREGDDTFYRGSVLWKAPQAPADAAACEPVAYDVRRLRDDGSYEVLTHRVLDAASPDPEKRLLDSPVQVAVSPPDLGIQSILASLSPIQLAARQVQLMVQAQDSAQMITAAQADAFVEMANVPITDFFGATPPGEFPHWVQLPPSIESVSRAYSLRSIDLFGRASTWTPDSTLQVKHQDALPMATDIRVERLGASDLEVSWMVDAEQIWSDAAVNHFRVLWRVEKADRQFLETAYYDLLGRSPSAAEYASQGERLR